MVIEENYPHAVSGIFADQRSARERAQALMEKSCLKPAQVKLVSPDDGRMSPKLEPESGRIFSTMLSAHLWTALSGLTAGIVLAWVLINIGPNWARSNPFFTVLAFAWVGTLATALLGGLITLRPDRTHLAVAARDAREEGNWTVVAHCRNQDEKRAALDQLEPASESTHQSL